MKNTELLFMVASEFIKLSDRKKMRIGFRMNLIDWKALHWNTEKIEESIFVNASNLNRIGDLVKEIERIKNEPG